MKTINKIIRVFSILTILAALYLVIFHGKTEGELIGSTINVVISSLAIFFVTYVPSMLKKRDIIMSKQLYILMLVAFLLTMGGGFVFRFYQIFNYYDTIIHFLNGMNLVIFVFVLLYYFAKEPKRHIIPIIFVSILAAISLGTLWEIYEYFVDLLVTGSNMQRFQDINTGIDFVGQLALKDTMVDLIVDTVGAILMGALLYVDSIRHNKFINKIILRKEVEENETSNLEITDVVNKEGFEDNNTKNNKK